MKAYRTKYKLKRAIEKLLSTQFNRGFGHSLNADLTRSNCTVRVIFDVGAHIGRITTEFNIEYPDAIIYSFEPVKSTFDELQENVGKYKNVICNRIALGEKSGQQKMYLTEKSSHNSLIEQQIATATELVMVVTLDIFSDSNEIEHIDILKVDTEGYDLKILKGGERMLSAGKITFVLLEVAFHPDNKKHVQFDAVKSYLFSKGYALFGIYDQQPEYLHKKRLRYANACFIYDS